MSESIKSELIKHMDDVNIANVADKSYYIKKINKFQSLVIDLCTDTQQKKYEAIITGSGSESNCLFIKSAVSFYQCKQHQKPHIITSKQEHKSIQLCIQQLLKEEKIELTEIGSSFDGIIDFDAIKSAIKPNTFVITLIHTNNETGIFQYKTINAIGKHIRSLDQDILIHVDGVQSFGKYPINMYQNNISAVSVSMYKIHGPNKLAALVINKDIQKIICGYPTINSSLLDSDSVSGGTLNLSLICAANRALKLISLNREAKNNRQLILKYYLLKQLSETFEIIQYEPNCVNTIMKNNNTWYIVYFSYFDKSAKNTLLFTIIRSIKKNNQSVLDGVCGKKLYDYFLINNVVVSNGSSCSKTSNHNYVLEHQGVPVKLHQGLIRVSTCDTTIQFELDQLVKVLNHYIDKVY